MKKIRTLFAFALAAGLAAPAYAMPVAPVAPQSQIEQVYGGCGPYGHRGPFGGCRWGGQWGGYGWGTACPPGFHLGPYGRRCWPSYY